MTNDKIRAMIAVAVLAVAHNAVAADIIWGGYLNATGGVSDSDTPYLASKIDKRGSYADTTFGINMGLDLGEGLQLAAQLATLPGHTSIELDWAFASYRLNNSFNVAMGRLKYPGNLVSEYINVGYVYPWIRPPQEVYSHNEVTAMVLEAFRGARILYSGDSGDIEYEAQFYVGAAEEETMNHDRMVGAVFTVSTGPTRLLLGFNHANMEMVNMPTAAMNGKDMTIWNAGATTEWHNLVAYAEYVDSKTEDIPLLDVVGWYTTLGYTFGKAMPHVTYSSLDQDTGIGQTSWTLGLRRELTHSSALKLEWQRIKPTAISAAGAAAVPMLIGRAGLFDLVPAGSGGSFIPVENEVDVFSISVSVLF